jgi:hypothetical protein
MLTSLKIVICPYPKNTQFVGRESILDQTRKELQYVDSTEVLQGGRTVVLYGLGGVGYKISLLSRYRLLIDAKFYLGNLKLLLHTPIGYMRPAQTSLYFGSMQLPLTNFFKATLISHGIVKYLDAKTQLVIRYNLLRIGLKITTTVNG